MKKTLFLLFGIFISITMFSQTYDDVQDYIKGDLLQYTENRQRHYKLYNIESKGIKFVKKDTIYGSEDNGSQKFVFERASFTNQNRKIEEFKTLKYWRWDASKNDGKGGWQEDVENGKSLAAYRNDFHMTVILNIDCSSSISSENFLTLKKAAISSIDKFYLASSNGNIRIGIRGFNSMKGTKVYPIKPLDETTKKEMITFINDLTLALNTAFYHSVDNAVRMIEEDAQSIKLEEDEVYSGSVIISFTDGFDNDSYNPDLGDMGEKMEDPYYKYMKKNIETKEIKDKKLESFIVAVNGEGSDLEDFKMLLEGLVSSSKDEHLFVLNDYSKIISQFESIARSLIDRWLNLECLIPSGRSATVRWTLGEQLPPKEPKDLFIGVNIGGGYLHSQYVKGLVGSIGFDCAFGITPKVACGFFVTYKTINHLSFGPLAVFGNYKDKMAFIVGLGVNINIPREYDFKDANTLVTYNRKIDTKAFFSGRVGLKFPPRLYLFTEVCAGKMSGRDHINIQYKSWTSNVVIVTLNLGVKF